MRLPSPRIPSSPLSSKKKAQLYNNNTSYERSSSMPRKGHVNSLRSTWENNTNLRRLSNDSSTMGSKQQREQYYSLDDYNEDGEAIISSINKQQQPKANKWMPPSPSSSSSSKMRRRSSPLLRISTSNNYRPPSPASSPSPSSNNNKLRYIVDGTRRTNGSNKVVGAPRSSSSQPPTPKSLSSIGGGGGSPSNNKLLLKRFVPNVNSPTWKSLQLSVKSLQHSVNGSFLPSPRRNNVVKLYNNNNNDPYSSPRGIGNKKRGGLIVAPSPKALGGDGRNNKSSFVLSSAAPSPKDQSNVYSEAPPPPLMTNISDEHESITAASTQSESLYWTTSSSYSKDELLLSGSGSGSKEEEEGHEIVESRYRGDMTRSDLANRDHRMNASAVDSGRDMNRRSSYGDIRDRKDEEDIAVRRNSIVSSKDEGAAAQQHREKEDDDTEMKKYATTKSTKSTTSSLLGSYVEKHNMAHQHPTSIGTPHLHHHYHDHHGGEDPSTTARAIITNNLSSDTSTSSLMYSMGDTTVKLVPSIEEEEDDDGGSTNELNKLMTGNLYGYSGHTDDKEEDEDRGMNSDDETADLVANTLAECRLLLNMSPPPTPIFNKKRKDSKDNGERVASQKKQEDDANKIEHIPQRPSLTYQRTVSTASTAPTTNNSLIGEDAVAGCSSSHISSNNNNSTTITSTSLSSSSFVNFLSCPTCHQEFSECNDNTVLPLHSFTCEHVICRECVFTTANNNPIVACPECGEGNAFDTDRPIVSRAYLSLVTKMKMEVLSSNCDKSGSITAMNDSKSGNNKMECTNNKVERRRREDDSNRGMMAHRGTTVPSQISVPSPRTSYADKIRAMTNAETNVETNVHEENASLGGASSAAASKSSLSVASSSTRRRQKALPTLAIDVNTTPATLNVLVPNENYEVGEVVPEDTNHTAATNPSSSMTTMMEPSTPVSRAEHRFIQRKEKLAQSLERVNRILERSKANRLEVEEKVVQYQHEKVKLYQNMDLKEEEEEDDGHDDMEEVETKKNEEEKIDELSRKLDELCRTSPMKQQPQIFIPDDYYQQPNPTTTSRHKPELRVDTGRTPSLPKQVTRRDKATAVKEDTTAASKDIFRTTTAEHDAPTKLIEFGTLFINQSNSAESSLTDMNDTLFLLGSQTVQNNTNTNGGSIVRRKKQPSSKANASSNRSTASQSIFSMDYPQQQQEQSSLSKCPQFLPSLNYSTMQESNERAGLTMTKKKNNNNGTTPVFGTSGSRSVSSTNTRGNGSRSSATKKRSRKPQQHKGLFKKLISQSFDDEALFPRRQAFDLQPQDQDNSNSCHYNTHEEQEGPTYEFSVGSCSVSPTSDDDNNRNNIGQQQLRNDYGNGSSGLVTHNPRRGLNNLIKKTLGRRNGQKTKISTKASF